MADPWELICHHNYTGIPGVVTDRSPLGSSHARAINIPDSEFLPDGMSSGSGSVRIVQEGQFIRIAGDAAPWRQLGGLKGEITFFRVPTTEWGGNQLLFAHGFGVSVHDSGLFFHFANELLDQGISSRDNPVGVPASFPYDQWYRIGFMYDGFSELELTLFDEVIARKSHLSGRIWAPDDFGVIIGNTTNGDTPGGHIDEVKVWRRNPFFVPDDFFGRPMDDGTSDCWRRYLVRLEDALREDPKCRGYGIGVIEKTIEKVKAAVFRSGDLSNVRSIAEEYKRLWGAAAIAGTEMQAIFSELIDLLRAIGAYPENDLDLTSFGESDCLHQIIERAGAIDCDDAFLEMFLNAGAAVGMDRQSSSRGKGVTR